MFEDTNILPSIARKEDPLLAGQGDGDVGGTSTRERFFGMTDDALEDELAIMKVCNQEEFYSLIKNEPLKYLSIIEFHPEGKVLGMRHHLELNRNETTNNIEIEFRFEDESNPDRISFSDPLPDGELIDQFARHLAAKMRYRNDPPPAVRNPKKKSCPSRDELPGVSLRDTPKMVRETQSASGTTETTLFQSLALIQQQLSLVIAQNQHLLSKLSDRH
jgi:hypothetical protein